MTTCQTSNHRVRVRVEVLKIAIWINQPPPELPNQAKSYTCTKQVPNNLVYYVRLFYTHNQVIVIERNCSGKEVREIPTGRCYNKVMGEAAWQGDDIRECNLPRIRFCIEIHRNTKYLKNALGLVAWVSIPTLWVRRRDIPIVSKSRGLRVLSSMRSMSAPPSKILSMAT